MLCEASPHKTRNTAPFQFTATQREIHLVRIYGILDSMPVHSEIDFEIIYRSFNAPISEIDCGDKCSPHNERGIPFCCDTQHAVPTAHQAEWEFLLRNTDLWKLWKTDNQEEFGRLKEITPEEHILMVCLGHENCQREYRSITCRSFPFFPYIDREGNFIGLSYYWEYEDRCWIISNLNIISRRYQEQFVSTFDGIFKRNPQEYEIFRLQSDLMRHVFARKERSIPVLHRDGEVYKISPTSGRIRRVSIESLPSFGVYKLAEEMPFSDEKSALHP